MNEKSNTSADSEMNFSVYHLLDEKRHALKFKHKIT